MFQEVPHRIEEAAVRLVVRGEQRLQAEDLSADQIRLRIRIRSRNHNTSSKIVRTARNCLFCLSLEIKLLGLVADNERKM